MSADNDLKPPETDEDWSSWLLSEASGPLAAVLGHGRGGEDDGDEHADAGAWVAAAHHPPR